MEGSKISILVLVAVAIIFAMVLIPQVANQVTTVTTTNAVTNQSITVPAVNGTTNLRGQGFQGTPTIVNESGGTDMYSNFTIYTDKSTGAAQLKFKTLDASANYVGWKVNVTYISEPIGYGDSATRGIVPIIVLLMAIVVIVFALWPTIRNIAEAR